MVATRLQQVRDTGRSAQIVGMYPHRRIAAAVARLHRIEGCGGIAAGNPRWKRNWRAASRRPNSRQSQPWMSAVSNAGQARTHRRSMRRMSLSSIFIGGVHFRWLGHRGRLRRSPRAGFSARVPHRGSRTRRLICGRNRRTLSQILTPGQRRSATRYRTDLIPRSQSSSAPTSRPGKSSTWPSVSFLAGGIAATYPECIGENYADGSGWWRRCRPPATRPARSSCQAAR